VPLRAGPKQQRAGERVRARAYVASDVNIERPFTVFSVLFRVRATHNLRKNNATPRRQPAQLAARSRNTEMRSANAHGWMNKAAVNYSLDYPFSELTSSASARRTIAGATISLPGCHLRTLPTAYNTLPSTCAAPSASRVRAASPSLLHIYTRRDTASDTSARHAANARQPPT
jgi:hypothetical protein